MPPTRRIRMFGPLSASAGEFPAIHHPTPLIALAKEDNVTVVPVPHWIAVHHPTAGAFIRCASPKDCSDHLNSPFEISEVPKTLVPHI
jgi:hypothetical protein